MRRGGAITKTRSNIAARRDRLLDVRCCAPVDEYNAPEDQKVVG